MPEAYMRPGCVLLTFDIFQPSYKKATGINDIVGALLGSHCTFWKEHDLLVIQHCVTCRRSRFLLVGPNRHRFQIHRVWGSEKVSLVAY